MLDPDKLEQVLHEIIACWGIPGLGIGIVEGEEIGYARGFGVQSPDTQSPVTPESVFGVASVSKCFVAAVRQVSIARMACRWFEGMRSAYFWR